MAVYTDIADEIYSKAEGSTPAGVQLSTSRRGAITLTRVEITRPGLARPMGRYVTISLPSVAVLDEKDERYIAAIAGELRGLLPAAGPVLVVGVGNRRVTADALGPRTAAQILVTRNITPHSPAASLGLREVASIAPGVSGATGIPLAQLLAGLVRSMRPAAVLCVDSLSSSEPARLGRTVQLTDTGLSPLRPESGKCITRETIGAPVLAVGLPTMMEAEDLCGDRGLVLTPRDLDGVVRRGAALLALAINKALQQRLTIPEIGYLAS